MGTSIDTDNITDIAAVNVRAALAEDVGDGDITAELIDAQATAHAEVISRMAGIFCGEPWVNETCRQVDSAIQTIWHVHDGESISPNQKLFELYGPARGLLTAERTMLNFVQLLSGTATAAHACVARVARVDGTTTEILDTRKTLPGLRAAQKYAVAIGGARNHRMGLYDAFLIKENHISAAGGISNAIRTARRNHPDKPVEIEVENLDELHGAIGAAPDIIMLDNFSLDDMNMAVRLNNNSAKLEASGGLSIDDLEAVAATGVDYISIGEITKRVDPLDLSMRFLTDIDERS